MARNVFDDDDDDDDDDGDDEDLWSANVYVHASIACSSRFSHLTFAAFATLAGLAHDVTDTDC